MLEYILETIDKKFVLNEENCSYFINDEEEPISGIEIEDIIKLLNESDEVLFLKEYYDQGCEACENNKREESQYYDYLEYHFYVFAKDGNYVISSISKEYAETSYTRLVNDKIVDASYIVSITACISCGEYSIELEQGTF